jgi:apolipoprotein N-acyltransferase
LVFLQLASITGMAGITFAAAWSAAVPVEIVVSQRAGAGVPGVANAWAALAACVVVFGSIRLDAAPAASRMVHVAGVPQNGGADGMPHTDEAIATMTDAERAACWP